MVPCNKGLQCFDGCFLLFIEKKNLMEQREVQSEIKENLYQDVLAKKKTIKSLVHKSTTGFQRHEFKDSRKSKET